MIGNLAAWTHGACIVYASEVYDPSAIVNAITQERCTALHGVPTHLLGVLGEAQKRREEGKVVDTSCLRYVQLLCIGQELYSDHCGLQDGRCCGLSGSN